MVVGTACSGLRAYQTLLARVHANRWGPCHAALPWLSAYAKSPAAITSCPGLQQAKAAKTERSYRYTGTGGGGLATADFFAPAIRPSNPPPRGWHDLGLR